VLQKYTIGQSAFKKSGRKMKITFTGNKILTLIVIIIAFASISSYAASDVELDEVEQILAVIETYQYGQSLEPMVRLDSILRQVTDEDHLADIEQMMINKLDSECTVDGKDQICRRLRYIGTENSAQVLSEMLNDPVTFEMALYALELIPGKNVDELLYREFMKRSESQKIRLINIMGIRSVEKAIPELKKLLLSSEEDFAAAAITAIGQMPPDTAIALLLSAMNKTTGDLQLRTANAAIQAAGKLSDQSESKSVYLSIYNSSIPVTIRFAALKQIIRIDPDQGNTLIIEAIDSNDKKLRTGALSLIDNLQNEEVINQIIADSSQYTTQEIMVLLKSLSARAESDYSDFFLDCAKHENHDIKIAGLHALRYSKSASVVPFLINIAAQTTGEEKSTARESLYLINAPDSDELIIKLVGESEGKEKIELIHCIGERQIESSKSMLIKLAADQDIQISRSAIKALKSVTDIHDIDALTELLINIDDPDGQNEIVGLLQNLVVQVEPPERRADGILEKMTRVSDKSDRILLMQILGVSGNPRALSLLADTLEQPDEELEKAAIRALSLWPDAQPADLLLNKVKNSNAKGNRVLAFRGYLTLLSRNKNLSDKDLLVRYQEAIEIAPDAGEQKRVFSNIASLNSLDAVELAAEYLKDKNLKPEAEAAIIDVCRKILLNSDSKKIKKILTEISTETENESIREAALELIDRIN
jgi:HEAT repeat protein